MSSLIQTFTWIIIPEGKRKKKILPLDERLRIYPALFIEKFGVAPRVVFMRTEMAEEWESDTVEGMKIIKLEKGYPLHMYSLAVTEEDFKEENKEKTNGNAQT